MQSKLLWPYAAAAVDIAVSLLASGHAVLHKRDTRSAMVWVGLIWLSPLVGAYELGASIWDVVLREDGALQVRMQTGQVFELEAARGTTFRVKERTGWSLEFKKDSSGTVTEVVFHQRGSSSVMKRKP